MVSIEWLILLSLSVLHITFSLSPTEVVPCGGNYDPTSLPLIDWAHYHNYTEIVTILLALNETYPNVVDVFSIGKSWGNRDIYCVRLTNESDQKPKPEVLFVGYHHAREQISSELPLYFVVYAATSFGLNETVTELINKSEIYVVVALNVDGFDLFETNDWQRKNARPIDEDDDGLVDEDPPEDEDGDGFIEQLIDYTDPQQPSFIRWEGIDNDSDGEYAEDWIGGVDLNRNYDYGWQGGVTSPRSEIYGGPAPFSEPETQAIRDFVLGHNFMHAISFHSGVELILYPWGYTYAPPPDEAEFIDIASNLSDITGGTPYMQASDLYTAHGAWDDWMYGAKDVLALTCEVFSNDTWEGVSDPGPYPNTSWEGGLRYMFNPFPNCVENVVLRWLPVFFYITNRTINEAFHNIAIDSIETKKTVIGEGYTVELNVSVRNMGFFTETFNVTLYANTTILETKTITITERNSTTVAFMWNTTGFAKGNYTISAYAWPVLGETDIGDNTLADGTVTVVHPGDLNNDGVVDIADVVLVSAVYRSKCGDPEYRPNSDIIEDCVIDIADVVSVTAHYRETSP
jgi:hypothetical protein